MDTAHVTDTEGPESPLAARPSTAVRPSTPVAVRSGLGLLLLAALGLLLWLDMAWERGFVFAAAGTAAVAVATDEFVRMAGRLGVALPRRALVLGAAGLFGLHWGASAYGPAFAGWYAAGAGLAVAAMMAFTERVLRVRIDGALQVVGASLLGLLYVPLLFAFLTSVRLGWGVAGVVAVVAVCKAGSSSAYFTGKYLGRRKLTPRLSPKKTVAGAVGQFAGATLMAVLLALSPAAVMTPAAASSTAP